MLNKLVIRNMQPWLKPKWLIFDERHVLMRTYTNRLKVK